MFSLFAARDVLIACHGRNLSRGMAHAHGITHLAHVGPYLSHNRGMAPLTQHSIPAELLQAYAQTEFVVEHDRTFTMTIGKACPALKPLLAAHNAVGAAFITAYNPFSQQQLGAQNRKRQALLQADLVARRLKFIPGAGKHPESGWPAEPSFLILDIDLKSAQAIAGKYGQYAFVWCAGDGVPQLVLG